MQVVPGLNCLPFPITQCHQHGVTWYPLYLQGSRYHTPASCPTLTGRTELLLTESHKGTTSTTRQPPETDPTEESIPLDGNKGNPTTGAPRDQDQRVHHGLPLIEGLTADTNLPSGEKGMPRLTRTGRAIADKVPVTPPPLLHRERSTEPLPPHLGQPPIIKATGTPRLQQPPPPPLLPLPPPRKGDSG